MKTLVSILQLVPALIEMIKAVEAMWPEGSKGKGSEKLALVNQLLTAAYDGISEMWPMIEKMVAALI